MVISVDTGNKQIKTAHQTFLSGIVPYDTVPPMAAPSDYIQYNGTYYVKSSKRGYYQKDKSNNDRYFILTLMAIVAELDRNEFQQEIRYINDKTYCISLLIGLPPAHMKDSRVKQNFKNYFLMSDPAKVTYKGKTWTIKINNVYMYPQCFAALMTVYPKFKNFPRALGIDIGGFTSDYVIMEKGRCDPCAVGSIENGVIAFYDAVSKECLERYDAIIEESDIDSILTGDEEYYDEKIVDTVDRCAKEYITNFLAKFKEKNIDLKQSFIIFAGGGSLLLKKYLEGSELIKRHMFIENINANAIGYEMLYAMNQKKTAE